MNPFSRRFRELAKRCKPKATIEKMTKTSWTWTTWPWRKNSRSKINFRVLRICRSNLLLLRLTIPRQKSIKLGHLLESKRRSLSLVTTKSTRIKRKKADLTGQKWTTLARSLTTWCLRWFRFGRISMILPLVSFTVLAVPWFIYQCS